MCITKVLKNVGIITLIIALIVIAILFVNRKTEEPIKEEYTMYNQNRVIKDIDPQLSELDIENIRNKKEIILEKNNN
ncbi:hypothetical protein [Miniphocaeibacter massiliensis]|uniref:hypothetical protein n=1 Tax=Miniphocaeibacter massiliensis TaxID=2041841 RepID=UPI000C0896D7|nr:hypothetical protein [Miniphocaeibacter massiliensis]